MRPPCAAARRRKLNDPALRPRVTRPLRMLGAAGTVKYETNLLGEIYFIIHNRRHFFGTFFTQGGGAGRGSTNPLLGKYQNMFDYKSFSYFRIFYGTGFAKYMRKIFRLCMLS